MSELAGSSLTAMRASSSRASARAWLTWPRESGSDQRSWTGCSWRTSGQVGGVRRLPVPALRVVRVGVHGALLGLRQDHRRLDLRVEVALGRVGGTLDGLLLREKVRP